MKFLVLTSSYPKFKGDFVGSFIYDFSINLKKKGFDVMVICPSFSKNENSHCTEDGIEVRRVGKKLLKFFKTPFYGNGVMENLKKNPFIFFKLPPFFLLFFIKGLKEANFSDFIISHWIFCWSIGSMISAILKKKHILYVHSLEPFMLKKFFRIFWCFFIKTSEKLIFVSNKDKERVEKILLYSIKEEFIKKSTVLPMGVKVEKFKNCRKKNYQSKNLKILWIGRIIEIKGLDVLLKALEGLEGFTLDVIGDGFLRKKMEKLSKKLRVPSKFHGYIYNEEKIKFFSSSHILVISSKTLKNGRSEGLPAVLFEGLASALCVIASNTGGIPEIIENGKNGILFKEGDFLELREKLILLKNNIELMKKIVKNGLKTVEDYKWEKIIEKFLNFVYKE